MKVLLYQELENKGVLFDVSFLKIKGIQVMKV